MIDLIITKLAELLFNKLEDRLLDLYGRTDDVRDYLTETEDVVKEIKRNTELISDDLERMQDNADNLERRLSDL
jgi:hypothetical protein